MVDMRNDQLIKPRLKMSIPLKPVGRACSLLSNGERVTFGEKPDRRKDAINDSHHEKSKLSRRVLMARWIFMRSSLSAENHCEPHILWVSPVAKTG